MNPIEGIESMKQKVLAVTSVGVRSPNGFEGWEVESSKVFDWNNSSDRKWFVNHLHWAMHNNRKVDMFPQDSN